MEKIISLEDTVQRLVNHLAELKREAENHKRASPATDELSSSGLGPGKDSTHRVIHLINNPTDKLIEERRRDIEVLERENEQLRSRLAILESGGAFDVSRRIDDALHSSYRIERLERKLEWLKQREEKTLETFNTTKREFQEACYLITGYLVVRKSDGVFQLSHMYAENEEDKLFFEVKRDGTVSMFENEYSNQCRRFMRDYLKVGDSFPAFLAAITLDLYYRSQSRPSDLSVDMSLEATLNYTMRAGRASGSLI